jgi:hypothetical protein
VKRALATLVAVVTLAALAAGCGSSTPSATVSAIAISPSICFVGRTNSKQLSAEATLPDGSKMDITSNAGTTWSTANSNTATVNSSGVVVGVNAGVTQVTASYGGASGSIDCTVTP